MYRRNNTKKNVNWVSGSGLCMGCGTCESVCPIVAIQVKLCSRKGIYLPIIETERCILCGRCFEVCPGAGVNIEEIADEILDSHGRDKNIGRFEVCYIGHSSSEAIRYNSASGGLITSLLIYALEKKMIDGALVLGMSETNPLETKPYIANGVPSGKTQ